MMMIRIKNTRDEAKEDVDNKEVATTEEENDAEDNVDAHDEPYEEEREEED